VVVAYLPEYLSLDANLGASLSRRNKPCLNLEVMQSFGKMGDGISLYAASLVSSRLYQAFAVYSYLQLIIGPIFTGILLGSMRRCFGILRATACLMALEPRRARHKGSRRDSMKCLLFDQGSGA